MANDFSLSSAAGFDGDELWMNLLKDERETPEEEVITSHDAVICKEIIEDALSNLNEREVFIVKSRRLSDFPVTLEAVGQKLGISKERVRQLEAKALRKMRHYLQDHMSEVKEFLE